MAPPKLIIETSPILGKMSGIGHNTLELIKAINNSPHDDIDIVLAVPFDRVGELKKIIPGEFKLKRIPLPIVVYNVLGKFNLVPPLDIFLGKGLYLFPNYRNTKLLFSKSLTYIYDASFKRFPEFVSPANQAYLVKNIDKWIKRTDRVLTISESSKAEISQQLDVAADKISIIPCGVDPQTFMPKPQPEINRLKAKYDIEGEYALYVGNIEPRKNLVRLVQAYKKVYDKQGGLKLLLIGGDGWQNKEINREINQAKAAGYPIIKPERYVPDEDLPALYSGATMLVHPALYEGFGISPLQAMSCATAVIVANNSSMPEVCGEAALYVNAKSIDDIAEKMLVYYKSKKIREDHIKKGLQRVKLFPWDKSAKELLSVVREVSNLSANGELT